MGEQTNIMARLIASIILLSCAIAFSETTCSVEGCQITITVKMAFAGANDSYVSQAEKEIEDEWNGPNKFRNTGDCACKFKVDVQAIKTTDCVNKPPPGYHCITVTNFFNANGSAYDNPPRNQTNLSGATLYIGYLFGVATGNGSNSQQGWFSDQMSRPAGGGQSYNDFAHEAGHLMGLDHNGNSSSIMNNTLAGPSQGDIDGAARAICGPDPCPDSCCCGNGKIDGDKGEKCDPLAQPQGCPAGESCCPVCCGCYSFPCLAAKGEYPTLSSCQQSCKPGASCYKNYKTLCYDCMKQEAVVTGNCLDPSNIRGNVDCDHPDSLFSDDAMEAMTRVRIIVPIMGDPISNERINIITDEGDEAHLVFLNGEVMESGAGSLPDQTMTIRCARQTITELLERRATLGGEIATGGLRFEGTGFLDGIKFFLMEISVKLEWALNPQEAPVKDGDEKGEPTQEYIDEIEKAFETETSGETIQETGSGRLPDAGIVG